MELLLSRNPQCTNNFSYNSVRDRYIELAETADQFNIATGYISNESIVELERLVNYRQNSLSVNLLIGMNYLDRFTRLQYDALKRLSQKFLEDHTGNIYVSKEVRYHGKMYSFVKNGVCTAAFIGSSNLGSFTGTSSDLIESDLFVEGNDAVLFDNRIQNIITSLGTNFADVPEVTEFQNAEFTLLNGHSFVRKLPPNRVHEIEAKQLATSIEIPLKTEPKSNLNAYFGAGKIKGRYSPRNWYEVELIINKGIPNYDLLPERDVVFTVVTDDGYEFQCQRQGDYGKNFRTLNDLKILGKWIKGHMEAEGALKLGEVVSAETLSRFGKTKLVLTKTSEPGIWTLKMV